ncbi:hypothetical protein RZS08_15620, partial [Arthrospira platensis SPKY1]|nr:hypothetical protein [Arthrospira platensis SPKY1]
MNKPKIIPPILLLVLCLGGFLPAAFAQSGKIQGKILDADTKETLIGATVNIQGSLTGAVADL